MTERTAEFLFRKYMFMCTGKWKRWTWLDKITFYIYTTLILMLLHLPSDSGIDLVIASYKSKCKGYAISLTMLQTIILYACFYTHVMVEISLVTFVQMQKCILKLSMSVSGHLHHSALPRVHMYEL